MRPKLLLLGGFGNQLFQIAFVLERYKDIEIDIESTFGSPRRNSIGKAEMWSYNFPEQLIEVNTPSNRVVSKFLNLALLENFSKKNNLNRRIKTTIVNRCAEIAATIYFKGRKRIVASDNVGFGVLTCDKTSKSDLVLGYFQSSKWFSAQTINLMRAIEPISKIDDIQYLVDESAVTRPIIVHVRLGDYELETGIGILPPRYYEDGLRKLTTLLPESEIWLFSNDLPKAKTIFSQWTGREIRFIEDTWNSTAATFEAMRLGQGYVIANSTFSYWAALLSRCPNPTVIAPAPWFLNSESPRDILPPNWMEMDSV